MKSLMVLASLFTVSAYAVEPVTIQCISNDAKYSVTVVKTVNGSNMTINEDRNMQVSSIPKNDPKYTKDVVEWFQGESKAGGHFTFRITDVKGQAGQASVLEDKDGKHLLNCRYPVKDEPKKKK